MKMQKKLKKMYWSIALSVVVILMILASFFIPSMHQYRGLVLILAVILEIPIWLLQQK